MRLIAVCDSDGAILTLMTMPLDGLRPSLLNLPPTQREVELDAPEISDELDNQEIHARLRDIGERFRVDLAQTSFVATSG